MKFFAAVVLSLASLAVAADVELPQCALSCFATAIASSGCTLEDTYCQCTTGKNAITTSVTPCVTKACSNEDLAKVLPASTKTCVDALAQHSSAAGNAKTSAASGASSAKTSATSSAAAAQQTANAAGSLRFETVGAGLCLAAVGLML
ncbi:hypothetical protein EJ06DRAFT_532134 [Trichodelitschia bisporula]|uniref:CFEM domain-containing protein n=1 Tax=Trichodelitschia bisporula TaxID=703511 RepID=A0A6G1HR89_9PEZI|nr:hypothetical protein EJ06DRAFT_532134 [Trichodelitschia bisporula]